MVPGRPEPIATADPAAAASAARPARTGSLPDVARAAALTAERDVIIRALDEFRWNRRKAARVLGVSYKTLLNKMKGCGISGPGVPEDPESTESTELPHAKAE
jgi:DNA-binding NtrC family response regulator